MALWLDGSEYIRVLARVEKETWESIDKKNKRHPKLRLKKDDARMTVKFNVSGIGFKLQGKMKKTFSRKKPYCIAGGREIGQNACESGPRAFGCNSPIRIQRLSCSGINSQQWQKAMRDTFQGQILNGLLDQRDSPIRKSRAIRRINPKNTSIPTAREWTLMGLREKTDVLSTEFDIGIGIQMDGIRQQDFAYIATSLGRGAGRNTPISGLAFGDANPDDRYGPEHWLLHDQVFEIYSCQTRR